jgi:recombination protein RecR
MASLEPFVRLVAELGRLPGVGRRSAERIAVGLVRDRDGLARRLEDSLSRMRESVRTCENCGNVTATDENPCRLCTDPSRDHHLLCVVEDPGDIVLIERAGSYKGRYHALMGKLSPSKAEGIRSIRLDSMIKRIDQDNVREVILALNTDVESDATVSFLKELLGSRPVKLSRLALGIPVGGGVSYADPVTLSRALDGRQELG